MVAVPATTLAATAPGASSLDVAGGVNAGSGNVGIIDASGRIPALSSTYFGNLDGSSLTGVQAATASTLARPGFSRSTLDGLTSDVGEYSSIAIGADGLGLISYWDVGRNDLKVAHCSDPSCASATTTTLGSGRWTSITIGADGLGLIAYQHLTGGLKVAHCTTVICSFVDATTLDAAAGGSISLTIGADGFGLISYESNAGQDLKVAHCSDSACSEGTITPFDTDITGDTSITIGM